LKIGLFTVGALIVACGSLPAQEDVAETTAKVAIDTTPIVETPITEADRQHWAFRPIVRPALPVVKDVSWPRGGVDAFILARLEEEGCQPAPSASRATLLRRLAFDLAGLPPTPDELAAFENDQSPDAYERTVDRLLASPAYGERWAQHWLDLARFAETDGFEHDKVRPQAWKYRDWVIAALNSDMAYDAFVRQQLAGDEGSGFRVQGSESPKSEIRNLKSEIPSPERLAPSPSIPTAFCLAGPDMPDINDQVERRHNLLNELTATVGAALLGLQMGCAQCHDHKYDPISQADFYRLRAIFESAVPPLKRDVPYNFLAEQKDAPAARFWVRGDHRRPGLEVQPAFPRIASGATAGLPSSVSTRASEGQATPTRSVSEGQDDAKLTRRASEGQATPTRSVSEESAPSGDSASLTLRVSFRSQFADWLFTAENPLTARVVSNRLWQHHFGRGIFETPSDVGLINAGPTHPQLLDWLAAEMRGGGWELKRMHRLIVHSSTYRQASAPRRLDGEAIRDAMLSAAGLLTSGRGGPGVMPPLPPELVGTLLKDQWKASPREADHYRRSIYVFARRNLRYPIFEAFDRPDANASCPVRNRSTTAPQSLVLLNSEFSLLAARHLAGRVRKGQESGTRDQESGTRDQEAAASDQEIVQWIEQLYLLALARRPVERETASLTKFLHDQRQRLSADARPASELALPIGYTDSADPYAAAALVDACLALLNASEFLYVD
jgi:hypothetical protein